MVDNSIDSTMKIIKLAEKSDPCMFTPKEALDEAVALSEGFAPTGVLIIMHNEDNEAEYYDGDDSAYAFVNGGGLTRSQMLWHLEQMKCALLEGRI